jgi:hypothetical protein
MGKIKINNNVLRQMNLFLIIFIYIILKVGVLIRIYRSPNDDIEHFLQSLDLYLP